MHRIFLGLAVTNGSLLLASYVVGLLAMGETRAQGVPDPWHLVHFLLGLFTMLTTPAFVHSIVYTYFLGRPTNGLQGSRPGLQDARVGRGKRRRRRTSGRQFRFEFWSMTLISVAAWFGGSSDAFGRNPIWHLATASVALAFNLGAFVVEYAVLVAQARLLLEVKGRADQQREALYGPEHAVDSGAGAAAR